MRESGEKEAEHSREFAKSGEPSGKGTVQEGGALQDRRPESSGASSPKESRRAARGPKRLRWRVHVVRIDPAKYPKFQNDSDHPYAGMDPDRRIEEIDTLCARLWARACEESAREKKTSGDAPRAAA